MLPDSQSKGKDSVDLIRDSLFAIQVQKPWLLLQFGNSDTEEIGTDRVEALVSASPSDEDGETRENIVKTEIEDNDNDNLTIPQVVNRLGMVFFLLIFNLGITIFIFLLTGMMLFSQILFIILLNRKFSTKKIIQKLQIKKTNRLRKMPFQTALHQS